MNINAAILILINVSRWRIRFTGWKINAKKATNYPQQQQGHLCVFIPDRINYTGDDPSLKQSVIIQIKKNLFVADSLRDSKFDIVVLAHFAAVSRISQRERQS